jgi:TM2 domain-containing membrane protein YozV
MEVKEMDKKNTHPGTAAVLSFIFNGLGQLYNGEIKKGLFVIFLSTLCILVFIIGAVLIGLWLLGKIISATHIIYGLLLFLTGIILICILGIWSIFDAYNVASKD